MLERFIQEVRTEATGAELPAATRERLKVFFAPGASRRMTLLGMMVGAALRDLVQGAGETIVYSSKYGESPALEGFLDSFPTASPTLFQTSIHPSAVQQVLIGRQYPVHELIPLAGDGQLVVQAALAAVLAPAPRVLWCGGEERGTWLREVGLASEQSFAFALALTTERSPATLGRISLGPIDGQGALELESWCELLQTRRTWQGVAGSGWELRLEWQ
jgi:hypothetical protein